MEVFQRVHRQNVKAFISTQIGQGTQGNIYKITVDGYRAALKDISNRNLLYRILIGRWLLLREYKIYQRLQDLPGIPKLYAQIDRDGFIIEYIEGTPLSNYAKDAPIPSIFFESLEKLVRGIHARGVVHSDLKHKKNILISNDFQPYLIDFGASFTQASAWNIPKNWLYKQFQQIDENALSKIRDRFLTGHPNKQDRKNLHHRNIMEKCSSLYQWIYRLFSKKHKWKRRARSTSSSSDK